MAAGKERDVILLMLTYEKATSHQQEYKERKAEKEGKDRKERKGEKRKKEGEKERQRTVQKYGCIVARSLAKLLREDRPHSLPLFFSLSSHVISILRRYCKERGHLYFCKSNLFEQERKRGRNAIASLSLSQEKEGN